MKHFQYLLVVVLLGWSATASAQLCEYPGKMWSPCPGGHVNTDFGGSPATDSGPPAKTINSLWARNAVYCDVFHATWKARPRRKNIDDVKLAVELEFKVVQSRTRTGSAGVEAILLSSGITAGPSGNLTLANVTTAKSPFSINKTVKELRSFCAKKRSPRHAVWLAGYTDTMKSILDGSAIDDSYAPSWEFEATNTAKVGLNVTFIIVNFGTSMARSVASTQSLKIKPDFKPKEQLPPFEE